MVLVMAKSPSMKSSIQSKFLGCGLKYGYSPD